MKITIVGLNHKTAPVAVRERLAMNAAQVSDALGRLKNSYHESEFAILSTCNRTELYIAARGGAGPGTDEAADFFSEYCSVPLSDFREFLYVRRDGQAVRHLLTVSASLDSLVIGEPQIIAQVKESYRLAIASGCAGKVLNRLFHCAFTTSKEVYTMTSIAQRRVSVAGVAVELAGRLFEDIKKASVAVVGAGEMGELLIRHLSDVGCKDITLFNRSRHRCQAVAEKYRIATGKWDDLKKHLDKTDIVVAAATAEEYLFDKSFIDRGRQGSLLIIDIAVPRNFDPSLNELENVHLYSVDDLARVIEANVEARQEDLGQAGEIIDDNVENFMDWFGLMDMGPLIGELRKKFHQISRAELERFLAGEDNITIVQKQKIESAVNRIVGKLLHRLIHSFHTVAREYGPNEANHLIESIIQYEDRGSGPVDQ